jgi:hypothetical protein
MRRRRSAQLTPALVERMDLADDAAGRVLIFSVDDDGPISPEASYPGPPGRHAGRLGELIDGRYTVVVAVNVLVVLLVLGLSLLRR